MTNSLDEAQASLFTAALTHPKEILPNTIPFYETPSGAAYLGDSRKLMAEIPDGSVNLVFTSPPYALHFKKEYGNVSKEDYVLWFLSFAQEIHRILTDDGSFEQGGGFDESPENQVFFLHYLASNNYVVEMELNEKCTRCDDKGYKVGLVPGAHRGQMDEVGNVMCDACKGEGGPKGKIEYVVTYSGVLPAMPETPAQKLFRSNLEKAKAGNVPAQILVGSNFWNGKGTAINLEEGMMWYGKAAMSGDVNAAQKVISLYSDRELKEFYDPGYAAMLSLLWLPDSEIDWKLIRHPNPKLGKIEANILLTEALNLMKSGTKYIIEINF
jgi:hypothetical protein